MRAEPVGSGLWLRPAARRLRVDLLSPQTAEVSGQSQTPEQRRVLASKLEKCEEIPKAENVDKVAESVKTREEKAESRASGAERRVERRECDVESGTAERIGRVERLFALAAL